MKYLCFMYINIYAVLVTVVQLQLICGQTVCSVYMGSYAWALGWAMYGCKLVLEDSGLDGSFIIHLVDHIHATESSTMPVCLQCNYNRPRPGSFIIISNWRHKKSFWSQELPGNVDIYSWSNCEAMPRQSISDCLRCWEQLSTGADMQICVKSTKTMHGRIDIYENKKYQNQCLLTHFTLPNQL